MTLTAAEKELVAIGASIGAGCHPCTEYHLAEGRKVGLAQDVLATALADAECVKRSAYNELVVRSRELIGDSAELPPSCCDDTNVSKEFVSVGSAVGANSVAQLTKHLDQARGVGIDAGRLAEAIEVARNVQHHAAEFTASQAKTLLERPAKAEPIFLTLTESKDECGDDCACNSTAPEQAASACCGQTAEVPEAVGVGAAPGKCC